MDPSTFTNWDGVEAVFTFGPGSPGMWLAIVAAAAIGAGVLARMIAHENQTFASLEPDLEGHGALRGASI